MSGHKTKVEAERYRVVCLDCPWFKYETGASTERLREIGGFHRHATEER